MASLTQESELIDSGSLFTHKLAMRSEITSTIYYADYWWKMLILFYANYVSSMEAGDSFRWTFSRMKVNYWDEKERRSFSMQTCEHPAHVPEVARLHLKQKISNFHQNVAISAELRLIQGFLVVRWQVAMWCNCISMRSHNEAIQYIYIALWTNTVMTNIRFYLSFLFFNCWSFLFWICHFLVDFYFGNENIQHRR